MSGLQRALQVSEQQGIDKGLLMRMKKGEAK